MYKLRLKKSTVLIVSAISVLTIGAIGWMHTPYARPFLAAVGIPCPVNQVQVTDVVRSHEIAVDALRGKNPAPARPALGLTLDGTSREEANAWIDANHLKCEELKRGLNYIRCRGISAETLKVAGPDISEMWLSFGTNERLIGINIYRRGMDAEQMSLAWSGATNALKVQLGKPTTSFGDPKPQSLLMSSLNTARVQYTYADYFAVITAVNLPQGGLALREQYLSGLRMAPAPT
jgi:hypothetical protein